MSRLDCRLNLRQPLPLILNGKPSWAEASVELRERDLFSSDGNYEPVRPFSG
jgi:hypothetical protein